MHQEDAGIIFLPEKNAGKENPRKERECVKDKTISCLLADFLIQWRTKIRKFMK